MWASALQPSWDQMQTHDVPIGRHICFSAGTVPAAGHPAQEPRSGDLPGPHRVIEATPRRKQQAALKDSIWGRKVPGRPAETPAQRLPARRHNKGWLCHHTPHHRLLLGLPAQVPSIGVLLKLRSPLGHRTAAARQTGRQGAGGRHSTCCPRLHIQ